MILFQNFLSLALESAPWLVLGLVLGGLIKTSLPIDFLNKHLQADSLGAISKATLLGAPLPLCSCGVVPAAVGLRKAGASKPATVSFLISTPQTGVDSILATYSLLGLPLAIIRPVVAFVTGLLGGVLANAGERNGKEADSADQGTEENYERSVKELFRYGFVELIQDISKWLVIGMLLAAFLSVLIPGDFFTSTISSEYLAMLLMIAASVPLYICATGSIPIAAVLLMKGLAPGAALVLLMAGPATNIATMAVIGNTLGKRSLWIYLGTIIGGALFFGVLVNELLPREWFTGAISSVAHVHDHTGWFKWASSALLVLLIINGYFLKLLSARKESRTDKEKASKMKEIQQYKVEGMTCDHCKATVENGLKDLEGVSEVIADRENSRVSIQSADLSDNLIKETIEKLGYRFAGKL